MVTRTTSRGVGAFGGACRHSSPAREFDRPYTLAVQASCVPVQPGQFDVPRGAMLDCERPKTPSRYL
jgi:hypothetical protein